MLLFGLLIGAMLMHLFVVSQDNNIANELFSKDNENSFLKRESELNGLVEDINDEQDEVFLNEIANLKEELAKLREYSSEKVEANKNNSQNELKVEIGPLSDKEYYAAMRELRKRHELLSAEEERVGTAGLEELIRNQPIELKPLFNEESKLSDTMMERRKNKYKKHLAEEKDINWAYETEGFLRNYFGSLRNSNFTALRIDCRSSQCEVAGVFNFDNVVSEMPIEQLASSGRLQSVIKVRRDVQQQVSYGSFFESGVRSVSFNPASFALNPMPYAFFFTRVK